MNNNNVLSEVVDYMCKIDSYVTFIINYNYSELNGFFCNGSFDQS